MVGVGVGMGVAVDAGMVEGEVVGCCCCVCTGGVPGSGWIRDAAVNSRFREKEKSRMSGI